MSGGEEYGSETQYSSKHIQERMLTQEENEFMTRVGARYAGGGDAAALLVAGGVYRSSAS